MANLAHNFALAICNLVSRVLSRVDNYCQLLTKRVSRPKKYCSDISKKKGQSTCDTGWALTMWSWVCLTLSTLRLFSTRRSLSSCISSFSISASATHCLWKKCLFIENMGGVRWELIQPPSIWRVSLQCATSQVCVTRCSHLLPLSVVVMPLNLPLRPLQITMIGNLSQKCQSSKCWHFVRYSNIYSPLALTFCYTCSEL